MRSAGSTRTLVKRLVQMLPDSRLVKCEGRDWHSLGFSGEHVIARLELGDAARAQHVAKVLPDAEFSLSGRFVADILVSDVVESEGGVILTIEALLLDE
jgi:hypothetical protein